MPITTITDTEARTPGLLLSEIDQRVVRVRPSATPLDQISRMGNFRKAGSMKVEYYSVDTKPISAVVESHTEVLDKAGLTYSRAVITDPAKGEDVSLTGGIWNQTDHTFTYDLADEAENIALDLVRQAFSGNTGSRRKILLAGSDLIDKLNRQPLTRTASASDTVTKWGIDFTEICSKFGRLYVVHSEIFDQCGAPGNGMVIDPDYITKYSFIPMQAERLQLKSSGQRNTDAIVITEASCLVLRHPDAHLRVIAG